MIYIYALFIPISLAYAEEMVRSRLGHWPAAIAIAILGLLSYWGIMIVFGITMYTRMMSYKKE